MNYPKLPKNFKAKWIKALRSGKYKQGKSNLRNYNNTYCCLGVACHIQGVTCITNKCFIEKNKNIRGMSKIPNQLIGNKSLPLELANMNDGDKSFKQIADWINKNL